MFYAGSAVIWTQNGLTPSRKSLEALTHQGVKSNPRLNRVNLKGLGLRFTTVSLLLAYGSTYWVGTNVRTCVKSKRTSSDALQFLFIRNCRIWYAWWFCLQYRRISLCVYIYVWVSVSLECLGLALFPETKCFSLWSRARWKCLCRSPFWVTASRRQCWVSLLI